ncbi:TfoX/Sxy family protein [Ulvibacter antarcticus]|uniref:DNA transformation protein n=1 Tax=Ulvibacter antarcticus TaxID=442714 RepID=A0A3L9Y8M4_9FLAO|nr:TfoX/Sxy family protein [Ulvibacter antarcticus]RMA57046.1 DNA transformation protein [Ulvibacter antarcticus]
MGIKGNEHTSAAEESANLLLDKLSGISGVTSKKMFGGHGIFHDGRMFGMIDSKGKSFLKTNETNIDDYLEKGSEKHSRMPYYSIPIEVQNDISSLSQWTQKSIAASKVRLK